MSPAKIQCFGKLGAYILQQFQWLEIIIKILREKKSRSNHTSCYCTNTILNCNSNPRKKKVDQIIIEIRMKKKGLQLRPLSLLTWRVQIPKAPWIYFFEQTKTNYPNWKSHEGNKHKRCLLQGSKSKNHLVHSSMLLRVWISFWSCEI